MSDMPPAAPLVPGPAPVAGQPTGVTPPVDYRNGPYGQEKELNAAAAQPTLPAATTDPMAQAEQEALTAQPRALLDPTERPDEHVMSGLAVGGGPGPEALGQPTMPRVASVIDALAARTGNPVLASLAAEAAASNL